MGQGKNLRQDMPDILGLCSTDTDRRISIGPIRIRGYVKFLQNLKAQRCIGVSDMDTRIRIGYVIRSHVEVSGLQRLCELAQQGDSGHGAKDPSGQARPRSHIIEKKAQAHTAVG